MTPNINITPDIKLSDKQTFGIESDMEIEGFSKKGEFVPEIALENPEALRNIHRDFQHAGSDVVQAFTYNGHREKMQIIGKE